MSYYVGILDGAKDVWGVRIPDVPGCYGGGETPEAAIADATSALSEVAAHWAAKGVEINAPRSMQQVLDDDSSGFDRDAGESLVMIPLLLDQARSVKANISLDAGLLEVIDNEAKLHGLTRSSYLASAARDKIVHRGEGQFNRSVRSVGKDTGDKRYIRRDAKGRIKEMDDMGRSLAADRRMRSKERSPAPPRKTEQRKDRKPGS